MSHTGTQNGLIILETGVNVNGMLWEMKSPTADNIRAISRNVRKAMHQSHNIVIDSYRVKRVPDAAIERELRKTVNELRSIRHLKFVNRKREVIDIK